MGEIAIAFVVLGFIGSYIGVFVAAVRGTVEASDQPSEAWERAGLRRNRWIWQAAGVLCWPIALVYSGVYYVRIRPRLLAASRELAVERCSAQGRPLPHRFPTGLAGAAIKMRTAPSVALTVALSLIVVQLSSVALTQMILGSVGPVRWEQFAIPALMTSVVVLPMYLAPGLILTPDDLVLRGLTRRAVAWCDVVAIEPRSQLGSGSVRVWTRTGGGIRLRAPLTFFGVGRQRFAADVAVLEHWWSTHTLATG